MLSDGEEILPAAKKAKTETTKKEQPKLDPNARSDDVFRKGTIAGQ